MEDPQLPGSRHLRGSLQMSQHSCSGEVSETDSGWSDVYREDSDSSLEDFDVYGNNDAISRQSTISSKDDDPIGGVQVEGTPSNHTRSAMLTSDEDEEEDSDEDDMWNSSGDWDGNDTTQEVVVQQQPPKPQRSNSRSSLDDYLQADQNDATLKKRDESTADSTDPSAASRRICHDQDRSGSLPPTTPTKVLHDLSTPLGLADISEQTQEIVFDEGEEDEDWGEQLMSQRNLQSSQSDGGWEEEEEDEAEVDWDDPDADDDWNDEEEEEPAAKEEDSAAWDYDKVGSQEEDDDIKAAASTDSKREPTNFAQQFVVSSSSPTPNQDTATEKSIVIDVAGRPGRKREEEKEEIQALHESDSSFSHVFEPVGGQLLRDHSQQETIPEGKPLKSITSASLAPTIKTDNSFRSKRSQASIPQNPSRQPQKRYHIHKGKSRTPQDWECLLAQWEQMDRAKKKQEQLRNRQTAAANYVQLTSGAASVGNNNNNQNTASKNYQGIEEDSDDLENNSNNQQEKKSKKNTGKCLGNVVFPFSFKGKKKKEKPNKSE